MAYNDECTSTKRMTSTAIYTSWVFRIQGTDSELIEGETHLGWGGGGGRGTWINFCGVLRTPTPLANYIPASHVGVFRERTKYEVP